MKIFDIFKRKRKELINETKIDNSLGENNFSQSKENLKTDEYVPKIVSSSKLDEENNENKNFRISSIAFAKVTYEKQEKNYLLYKSKLIEFYSNNNNLLYEKDKSHLKEFYSDENIFIFDTIGLILLYFYDSDKSSAIKLYKDLAQEYPENEEIIWLNIEVICLINIDDSIVFARQYLDKKNEVHDFGYQYNIEYQKGLALKRMGYYKEAIELWTSLNKIKEFSWNYYQVGILQNKLNDPNFFENIKRGIEMDINIKEDAKKYHELDNLRTNLKFLKLLE